MPLDQKMTEMILINSLKEIRMHMEIFRRVREDCMNHVPAPDPNTPRCTRRYNKNQLGIKFCEVHWCPLLKEV